MSKLNLKGKISFILFIVFLIISDIFFNFEQIPVAFVSLIVAIIFAVLLVMYHGNNTMIKSNIKRKFNCDIETIWNIITDNRNYTWRSDLSKIEIIDDTHFIEYDKNDSPTKFTIISNKRLKEYQFDIENTNIKGKWIGLFKQLSNGKVELDFTEEIVTNNLILKLLAKPYLKSMQKRYIKDLERRLSK